MTLDSCAPQLEDVLTQLKRLKPTLADRWGVKELAVFGSVARGEATVNSDIDILYDTDQALGWELASLGDFLEAELSRKVDLLSRQAVRPVVWGFIGSEMRYV